MRRSGERHGEAPVESRAVVLGVNLSDFGREHTVVRPNPDTHTERHERWVMVDAEHARGHQLMPLEILHVDARHQGTLPLAETSYAYAKRPDETVVIQSIQQIVRTEHGLETQSIVRTFDSGGEVRREQLMVNRAIAGERIYAPAESVDGKMICDTFFDTRGRTVTRHVYARHSNEQTWKVTTTRYTYESDRLSSEEATSRRVRLSAPPAFEGVLLLKHVAAPSLPYEERAPVICIEDSDR